MKITGVITEYNPFHRGHLYHLEESRRLTGADFLVAAMSGSFLQRGEPAVLNKYERTRMALLCGADVVLELPAAYACASAEHFAFGGICLLDGLSGVTDFVFGSESGDLAPLALAASVLSEEPAPFRQALSRRLKEGLSFPAARQAALAEACPSLTSCALSGPNDILGMEYLKALLRTHSPIRPHCIRRQGSGYHDGSLSDSGFSSASAIRSAVFSGISPEELQGQLPEPVLSILKEQQGLRFPIEDRDFSALLHYRLLLPGPSFETYADVSEELAARIRRLLPAYTDIRSFTDLLKTRNYTRTRIARCLTHLLIGLKEADLRAARESPHPVPYARVLGFRREAVPCLHLLRSKTRIPLLTKMADARRTLAAHYKDEPAQLELADTLLQQDIFAANVYEAAAAGKFGVPPINEYRGGPVIL